VLVVLKLTRDIPAVPLVAVGAVSAAAGRYCLAVGAQHVRTRLSADRKESLDALRARVEGNRAGALAGLGLFALSPVPSAQLFVAAGLAGVALLPLTAAFFAGRLVSYSLWVGAASAAHDRLGPALLDSLRSPWGIALQVVMLGMLVALVRVDWARVLSRPRRVA
jgi:membrane protein YqaA with SNARE-associated domain